MITVTMIGILLGLTVPTFKEAIRNNRIVSQNNEFIGALNYARSEAIRRSSTVSVCSSTNGTSCSTTNSWGTGWISFVDEDADGTLNGSEVVMQVSPPVIAGFTLNGDTGLTDVRFGGNGILLTTSPTGAFLLQKTGCTGLNARQISISRDRASVHQKVACS